MANADISNVDVEDTIDLGGQDLKPDVARDINQLCVEINSDVNLYLTRLGFVLPITDTQSLDWIRLTKKYGATALALDYLVGQDSEEENTRAQRFWKRYQDRIKQLLDMGTGTLPGATVQTSPRPNSAPVAVGSTSNMSLMNPMRFPQRAAVEHDINRTSIRSGKFARIASRH